MKQSVNTVTIIQFTNDMKKTIVTEFSLLSAALELVKRPNFKCGSGIKKSLIMRLSKTAERKNAAEK